jgi:tRNA modification GTPase
MFSTDDTIVAIATPPGRGGLGVVRVSGPQVRAIASSLLERGAVEPRRATFTRVRDAEGSAVDHVVATLFAAPASYTGEDVLEISAHGSPFLLTTIVRAAIAAGARHAEPGEFTLRAFLHGRLTLAQAEAVADLVNASTTAQARAAFDQLDGTLTGAIAGIDRALFDVIARLEASLDFPDEGYHFVTPEETCAAIRDVINRVAELLREAERGRPVREGRQAAICGRPNSGKSSLFNKLLGFDRAIVTDAPGTTRDPVAETAAIEGVPVRLVDTAGLRRAVEEAELEGVLRARRAIDTADVVIVTLDRSRALAEQDHELIAATAFRPHVVVANKHDLPPMWSVEQARVPVIELSLVTGAGLDSVRRAIGDALLGCDEHRETPAVTNVRHVALLERACESLSRAQDRATAGAPEEIVLVDLSDARSALEEITGVRTSEDVLRHIFATFCVGK